MIDAHQHFFRAGAGEYPWMRGRFAPLASDFAPSDLRPLLAASGVSRTVLVQTYSSEEETKGFLRLAAQTDFVAGVVGWVDLTAADVCQTLARMRGESEGELLVGVRHQVHDEPDAEWLLRDDVQRGLAATGAHGLVYDLLIRPRELPAAIACARRNRALQFVVDHIAKPPIRAGTMDGWLEEMRELAALDNVACKISGLVTEADWERWQVSDLRPYVEEVLEMFGPARCMLGSDWPVSQLVAPYACVLDASLECLSGLAPDERASVTEGTAERVYGLRP